jgi:hypothetical protein
MRYASILAVLVMFFAAGCSARSTADPGSMQYSNPRLITFEEIQQLHARDAYEVVARLRPNWITRRGPQSFQDPTAGQVNVFIDDVRVGGAELLRLLHAQDVASIRYMQDVEAAARFGSKTRGGGVILVRSRVGT